MATAARLLIPGGAVAYMAIDPKTVIPDNAFIPDISGVCSKEGTAEIIRYPRIAQTTRKIIIVGVKKKTSLPLKGRDNMRFRFNV